MDNRDALRSSSESIDENIVILTEFPAYYEHIRKLIDFASIKKAGLKIAADMLYGAGINVFPKILDEISGNETRVLNNKRDALFGGKLPDPSEKNLVELKKIILEKRFDIGVALEMCIRDRAKTAQTPKILRNWLLLSRKKHTMLKMNWN